MHNTSSRDRGQVNAVNSPLEMCSSLLVFLLPPQPLLLVPSLEPAPLLGPQILATSELHQESVSSPSLLLK